MIIDVTDQTFDQIVAQESSVPVLVDVWAEWCGPCKSLVPILSKVSANLNGKVKVVKINADTAIKVRDNLGIRGLPTLLIMKQGQEVGRHVGALSEQQLIDFINKLI